MSAGSLQGKVAVVTGAGRGIGRAVALGWARAGASVCCAARTAAEIESTAEAIASEGGVAIAVPADVADLPGVERTFAAAAEAFGGIDLVLVNAGVDGGRGPVEGSDPERWRETIEINLLGAYYCTRAAIPHLRRRGGGKIIQVGSGLGHRGVPGTSAYAASKAGLWMLTRVLAQELRGDRISVNELIPGPVETSMTDPGGSAFSGSGEWIKRPEDVVPLALFLATQPDDGPTAQSFSLMRRDG